VPASPPDQPRWSASAPTLIEALAGVTVVWRFAVARLSSQDAERRAQQLIALSFYAIAAYVGVEAIRTLIGGSHPDASWVGIGLAAVTLATMPPLAIAKSRVATALGSPATASEGRQNMLCAYLSAALLVGLGLNAVAGLWWADPITALVIAAVAVREGRSAWRGDACCAAPVAGADECCT
jgi:divalent metal cation (Fe/Co/Zn/Cd) transporter